MVSLNFWAKRAGRKVRDRKVYAGIWPGWGWDYLSWAWKGISKPVNSDRYWDGS